MHLLKLSNMFSKFRRCVCDNPTKDVKLVIDKEGNWKIGYDVTTVDAINAQSFDITKNGFVLKDMSEESHTDFYVLMEGKLIV